MDPKNQLTELSELLACSSEQEMSLVNDWRDAVSQIIESLETCQYADALEEAKLLKEDMQKIENILSRYSSQVAMLVSSIGEGKK